MKKKLQIMTLLALVGCTASPKEKEPENNTVSEIVETPKIETPHHLELNEGNKWQVDQGIAKGIAAINKLVKAHISHQVLDYQLLGDAIATQTKYIISSCTMKGKAHEELHKWLLPFLDLKEALVMTASPEEGAAVLDNIKSELAVYQSYFK